VRLAFRAGVTLERAGSIDRLVAHRRACRFIACRFIAYFRFMHSIHVNHVLRHTRQFCFLYTWQQCMHQQRR
jgi:hypothetical protein